MVTITTRELGATAKGSPLSNSEIDTNFINLKTGVEDLPGDIAEITKDMIGFPNRTDSTVSFDEASRTVTLAPVSTSFSVYNVGQLVTINTSKTLVIANTSGGRYIKYNVTTEALEEIVGYPTFATEILVAYVYWDAVNSKALVFGDERHGSFRDTQWHLHQHLNVGAIWRSGGAATYTLDAPATMNIGFSSPISLLDEDISHTITHSASPSANYYQILEGTAQLPILYKSGSSYVMITPSSYPWIAPTGSGCVRYNPLTDGNGALADSDGNKYVVYWIVATSDAKYPIKAFPGHLQHSTLDEAFSESFDISGFSLPEIAVMYQIVLKTSSSTANTFKAVITAVRRATSSANYQAAILPSDHSNLTGRTNADQHPISAISGLQTALDAKLAASSYTAEDVLTKIKTVDGASSGLDADTVDGLNPETTNTANSLVKRDSSGNFSAGTITASLSGNASTASTLATSRTITLSGDVTGNISFNGSADVTIPATVRVASTSQTGIVQLTDSTSTTSSTLAATATAVKAAYDLGAAAIPASQKGAANGVATLDGTGLVPSVQLPSYVDDVLEYSNLASFPVTGATGKIYVALDTNKTYRWSGSAYIEISASPGSTDSVTEGSTNLYFTNARARSAVSASGSISYNSSTGVFSYTQPTNISTFTNDSGYATTSYVSSNFQATNTALTALLSLPATTGFIRKTGATTWTIDTSTYLTGNQSISLSGDVSGSGNTSISVTLNTVPASKGGTGITSYNTFDLLYAGGSTLLSKLSPNVTTTKKFLHTVGNGSSVTTLGYVEVSKSDVGLSSVENTALSSWTGSTNLQTLGSISTGTWNASTISPSRGGTGLTSVGSSGNVLTSNGSNWVSSAPTGVSTGKAIAMSMIFGG